MSHLVVFTILFHLIWDRGRQGIVLKLIKNDYFNVFFAVWVLFPKFLSSLKRGLY